MSIVGIHTRKRNSVASLYRCDEIEGFFNELLLPFVSIRVTQECNLNCIHCYANAGDSCYGRYSSGRRELTTTELLELLNELSSLGGIGVRFTGGEPFLRNDIDAILSYAQSCNLLIYINTNGTLITNRIVNSLKRIKIKLLQISLDGPTQKTNDAIRGDGSFEKATNAVQLLSKSLTNVDVAVGTVIMKRNYQMASRMIDLSIRLNARICAFMFMLPIGRASEIQNQNITFLEKQKIMANLFQKYRTCVDKTRLILTVPPALFPEEFRWKAGIPRNEYCSFPYLVSIMANGDVYPCEGLSSIPEFLAGNIRKQSLKQIWQTSKVLRKIRSISADDLKGVCRKCKFRKTCIGGCRAASYLHYGDFYMPDPLCQKLYEEKLFPKDCLG